MQDELNENGLVSYYGYDYKGDELNSAASIEDFFTETNDKEDFTRNIGAFEPIYTAGYIQDKFAFDDLIFSFMLLKNLHHIVYFVRLYNYFDLTQKNKLYLQFLLARQIS